MVIKYNILLLCIFLLVVCLFTHYSNQFTSFDKYIKNVIFDGKEILDEKIYVIKKLKFKTRITYTERGTYFRVYNNPNEDEMLFELKYWTKISPIEIISINGNILVKIETKGNRVGWISSQYIEIHRSACDWRRVTLFKIARKSDFQQKKSVKKMI
jgi:hypothetical protein